MKELLENDDEEYGEPRTEDYGEYEEEDENTREIEHIPVIKKPQKRTWAGMDLFSKSKSRKIVRHLPDGIDIGRLGLPLTEIVDAFDVGEFPEDLVTTTEYEKSKDNPQDVEMTNYEAVIQKVPNPMISDGKPQSESEAMEVEPSTSEAKSMQEAMEVDSKDKQPVKAIVNLVVSFSNGDF